MRPLLCTLFALTAAAASPGVARADDVVSYALVVGSNRPGPGQAPLAFAEDDAREVADVLRDLGGYAPSRVQVVLNPSARARGCRSAPTSSRSRRCARGCSRPAPR